MEKVAQLSGNQQAIKNREAVLVLLKQECAALRATMHVQAPVAPAGPVAQAQAAPETDVVVRKRQMEREDVLFEMELAERKLVMAERQQRLLLQTVNTQKTLMETYQSLCPDMVIDDRAKIMFKDTLMNLTSQSALGGSASSQLAIGNGLWTSSKPMTISVYALSKGYRFNNEQLQEIGTRMAKKYRQKYGEKPSKHPQSVGGSHPMVNSYFEKDWDILDDVIKEYVSDQESERDDEQRGGKKSGKKNGKSSGQNSGQKKISSYMPVERERLYDENEDD